LGLEVLGRPQGEAPIAVVRQVAAVLERRPELGRQDDPSLRIERVLVASEEPCHVESLLPPRAPCAGPSHRAGPCSAGLPFAPLATTVRPNPPPVNPGGAPCPPLRGLRDDGRMGDARRVVEQLVEVINRHDVDGGGPLFAPAARCVSAQGRTLSLQGLRDMLRTTLAAFPDLTVTVQRWIEQGDTVVTEELFEGTHVGYFAGLGP